MGCFGFIGDLLGFATVRRGWKTNARLTTAALLLFFSWAFLTGMMVVRYAHLGEHPYVFEILPIVSCASPVVAFVGVILFTIGDAITNVFSTALTHSFGVEPPFNLYKALGQPQPLLTWGAYVRLNLFGLMSYALLPGLFSRLLSRLFQGLFKGTKKAIGAIRADGPPPRGFVPPPDPETIRRAAQRASEGLREGAASNLREDGVSGRLREEMTGAEPLVSVDEPMLTGFDAISGKPGDVLVSVDEPMIRMPSEGAPAAGVGESARAALRGDGFDHLTERGRMMAEMDGLTTHEPMTREAGDVLVSVDEPLIRNPSDASVKDVDAPWRLKEIDDGGGFIPPIRGERSRGLIQQMMLERLNALRRLEAARRAAGDAIPTPPAPGTRPPLPPGGGPGFSPPMGGGGGRGGRGLSPFGPHPPLGPDWSGVIPGYIGAIIGAGAGVGLGGGIYYGDMWAEYHPIREATMGSPDPSCFKMDADYAVQNVVTGGTMAPVAGASAVAAGAGGGAAAGGAAGGSGTGGRTPGGQPAAGDDEEMELDASGTVLGATKGAGDEALNAEKAGIESEMDELKTNDGQRVKGETGIDPNNPKEVDAWRNQQKDLANQHGEAIDAERAAEGRTKDLDDRIRNTSDPAEKARLQAEHDAARKDLDQARNRKADLDTEMKNARAKDKVISDYNAKRTDLNDRINDVEARSKRLGQTSDVANIILDWKNLMEKDGMSFVEAGVTSIAGNLGANAATGNISAADFAAGIFFPQSMQGYIPGNVVKDSVKTGMNAFKAASQYAGGDTEAFDRYGQSAMDGNEGKIAEGYANIGDVLGGFWENPTGSVKDLADGVRDIWNAGPMDLIGEAAEKFGADALAGKEGPMAQTVAEAAQGLGRLSTDPVGVAGELKDDVSTIMEHGSPSDLIFGEEGSNRATQILGPIGEGYKEAAGLAGEIYENPSGFATDVKDTSIYVVKETAGAIRDTASGAWSGFKGFFGYK